jgi:uncharacterized protein
MQIETVPSPVEENRPKPNIWSGWPAVGFSAAIFAVFFTVQNLVAMIFMTAQLAQIPSFNSPTELMDFIMGFQSNGLMLSIAIIVSGICGFFLVWLFIKIRNGYSFNDYLELKAPGWRTWISLIAVMIVAYGFLLFVSRFHSDTENTQIMIDAYLSCGWTPIFWIATVVFAPIFEESFFRGFLFVGLRDSRVGSAWTVIITSVVFALAHIQYDWFGFLIVLGLGLVFGLVRLFSRSLWSTIALHTAWNLLQMIGVAIYIQNPA